MLGESEDEEYQRYKARKRALMETMRPLFEAERFRSYLEDLPADSICGIRRSERFCPIAQYLQRNDYPRATVRLEYIDPDPDDVDVPQISAGSDYPEWVDNFVLVFDGSPSDIDATPDFCAQVLDLVLAGYGEWSEDTLDEQEKRDDATD